MGGGLRDSSMRSHRLRSGGDVDPMSSLANLADVMLVFACGLMMALVSFWEIDISVYSEIEDDQMEAIEEPGDLPEEILSGGSAYVEKGMVYQDPTTGKYYMLADDAAGLGEDASSGADASGSDGASGSSGASTGSGSADTGSGTSTGSSGGSSDDGSGANRVSSGASVPDRSLGAD